MVGWGRARVLLLCGRELVACTLVWTDDSVAGLVRGCDRKRALLSPDEPPELALAGSMCLHFRYGMLRVRS